MTTERTGTLHDTEVGGPGGARTVFLHGLFGQGKNFTQAARTLEPDLHSLLVDLPNHGRSAWTDSVDYVDVADAVADHLRGGFAADGPVHLVGHSMGGKVAMVLALRHPDLVGRLVVVDISPTANGGTGEFEHLLDSLARLDVDAVARRADADRLLSEDIPDERVRGFLLQNLRSHGADFRWQANLALLRAELATIGGFPDASQLGDGVFDHPVLWLAGERSSYVRDEHDATMRRLFPRTRLVTIKGAGHWVHSEQPEAFVSALRVFLTA
ncbi:alpha/beta fold hydrolase [Nocardioides sp. zg-579]|uniref:Alpha/beta fold hydrolase n=1 Tax=Nocardioides marmotae TaxID=2663857 RepID=A0A6I3J9T8_9ACTN|nr:alpha/beta fold hydrolase [Nocardioides marmotae]MCR6030831.1 alpha/beta fold hydrolase [Gordonia jinghuaiqii]MTB94468.1 alpha/beta fold hydrolase [Nocardioides marmotae]QKE01511.1 alpha/beta fold hydrolase [Nocardioides marmotae]